MPLSQPKHPAQTHRILLAAANQVGTKARKVLLEEKGHEVLITSKAKDAMHHLEAGGLALVIVDCNLEHGKGLELLQEVCAHASGLPTILLADPVQGLELDGAACQPDIVVAKQFDEVTQLQRAVEKLLRRRVPRKKPGSVSGAPPKKRKQG
ncbi:MAG: response regulator [Bryobacterales bacterium]|jgi:DNA-binding response OmpR family regulator|nr:response regulator [Bryobacterales bacterium]